MLRTIQAILVRLKGSSAGGGETSRAVSELAVSDRSKGVFSVAVGAVEKLSLSPTSPGGAATTSSLPVMMDYSPPWEFATGLRVSGFCCGNKGGEVNVMRSLREGIP